MTLLFVYGTLKRGGPANRLIADQRFAGAAVTEPGYRVYDLGAFPGLAEVPGGGLAVAGELWDVSDCSLAELDDYEGVPELFARRPVRVAGVAEVVEAYFYAGPIPPDARSGDRWPLPS